jgi:RNA recognition motif-containing protein
MNIYIGNLPFNAKEDEIREVFAGYGQVNSVTIIIDKMSGRSRGFGFVEMAEDAEAQNAIQGLNGKDFMGRGMVVNEARPREDRGDYRGGGGGGSRGGYKSGRRTDDRKKSGW